MVNKVVEKKVIEEVKEVKVELTLTPDQYEVLNFVLSNYSFEGELDRLQGSFMDPILGITPPGMFSDDMFETAQRKDSLLKDILLQLRD